MKYITKVTIRKFKPNSTEIEYEVSEFYSSRKKAIEIYENIGYELDEEINSKHLTYMFKGEKSASITREILH